MLVTEFMAIELIQPPIRACHVVPTTHKMRKMIKTSRATPATHLKLKKSSGLGEQASGLRPTYIVRAAERGSGLVGEQEAEVSEESKAIPQIKAALNQALQGINRGIFGVPSAKKSEILGLVELLEAQNPTPDPTQDLNKVGGCWKLIYSTISILGAKRTKLGLRDFISLGDFFQNIYVAEGKAVNVIKFNARGLSLLNGELIIQASFKITSKSRVDIEYGSSTITPDQLMNVFQKNYDLLLGIFNPEGWLEITYVDESMRIGRDDKGNIFLLERSKQENS